MNIQSNNTKIRSLFKLSVSLFIALCITMQVFAQSQTQIRSKTKFNNDWKFSLSDNPKFMEPDCDDSIWRNLSLPHDWTIEGAFDEKNPCGASGAFLPGGIGWYRKTFLVNDSLKLKKVFIQFDGIHMNSEVWINNHFLGRYPNGYLTILYDLTPFLKVGQKNTIAVRVDNSLEPSTRYYGGAGIYRNTWLIVTNPTHFDNKKGVFVSFKNVSPQSATINCNYEIITNAFAGSEFEWWRQNPNLNVRITKQVKLSTILLDAKGKAIEKISEEFPLSDFKKHLVSQQLNVKNPNLWSASNPVLYYLKSTIEIDNKLIDDLITPIGIRSVEYDINKGMLVNGKSEKLKGVCLHQDAGSLGNAVPDGVWHYRLSKLKLMGANAIRTSHHPFAPEFYDMCDSMGIYIMDEAFDEWNSGYGFTSENTDGKMKYGYHLHFNQWAETDLKSMVQRDRNHPSVVMYSIGNEIPNQQRDDGANLAAKLQNICHAEDHTRKVTAGCDLVAFANKNGFLDTLDIAGYNYVGRFTNQQMYEPERKKYPNRLFVGTETYFDSYYWRAVRDNDYVIGEFLWAGFDYLGEGIAWPKRGWDACLIDMAGKERSEYYLRKCFWNTEPELHIAVRYADKSETNWHPRPVLSHWNWKWNANYLNQVYVYSNCDEVEVLINNVSVEKKPVDKNESYALFMLPFNYGEIKAIGYINGKPVKNHVLTTAGSAKLFNALCNKNTLKANGEDVAIIELNAVDEKGIPVYDFNADVTVELSGDIELIGIDCANQRSHEQYKKNSRKAFNGRLLVTVKAGVKNGNASIRFLSPNMITKEVQLSLK